ncbi:MAG: response regulator [SAR324 cluster bacterium]|nr:response regulator [SAR324 cluster bacterium]
MAKRVLVVDDSAIVRNIHSFMLKSDGFDVEEASNGYEAMEKLLESTFDLIVTDINMPKMDGYALCEAVRKENEYANTPVIIISTESEADDKLKGFKAGANLYIVKPVKSEELIQHANMLVGGNQ